MARIVDTGEWVAARQALLEKEKALTKLREEVAEERRGLPWRLIKKDYEFEDESGRYTLGDLFADQKQLIVVHFMYAPGWEAGCKICSFWADQYDRIRSHIVARDVSLVVVSRALHAEFVAFKQRMGWEFPWYSSSNCEFNADFGVSFPGQETGNYNYRETKVMEEHPGVSVFAKDAQGDVYHTYSVYSRGLDALNSTYQFLDLVPKGRNEQDLPFSMAWVNHRDQYS